MAIQQKSVGVPCDVMTCAVETWRWFSIKTILIIEFVSTVNKLNLIFINSEKEIHLWYGILDGSVGIQAVLWTERSGFDSRKGDDVSLCSAAFTPALGHTEPLVQLVWGALSLEAKRPWHEADHSSPSSAELYLHSPICPSGMLTNHRDKFTLYVSDIRIGTSFLLLKKRTFCWSAFQTVHRLRRYANMPQSECM